MTEKYYSVHGKSYEMAAQPISIFLADNGRIGDGLITDPEQGLFGSYGLVSGCFTTARSRTKYMP